MLCEWCGVEWCVVRNGVWCGLMCVCEVCGVV